MEIDYDIFISFKNSDKEGNLTRDRELAEKLYYFLKSKNLKIFFSETTLQEIGSGTWQKEIKKALKSSKIFIALGTKEEYFKSEWVQWERTTFLTRKEDDDSRAIYSYIAPPMTTPKLPKDIEYFECFNHSRPDEFERLYGFISSHLKQYFRIYDISANPYKGLQSFGYKDRKNYYGREDESKKLAKILKTTRFFTLLGASGSGKSSLIFAGILPIIKEDGIKVLSLRPLDNPFKSVASIFIPILYSDKIEQIEQKEKLTQKMINSEVKLNNLVEIFLEEINATKLYLIIDQFEELFTLTKDKEIKNLFLQQLLQLVNSSVNITLLISMRSDFLSHISYYESFNQAFNDYPPHILGLFGKERLREIIEKPSQRLGVSFQNGLIENIIDEIAKEAGQLPLLEFALHQLWIHKEDRVISFESLNRIGGISKSISLYADEVYQKHIKRDSSIKRIFINLVNVGRGTVDTKKRAKLDDFNKEDRETILLLANTRLIITDKNEIEIVHEAIIREWKQLKDWIDEYRDFLQWQERIRIDRNFYQKDSQKDNLLRYGKLFEAKDFLKSHYEYISVQDREFIQKSIKSDKWERTKKRMIFSLVSLAISGLAFYGFGQKELAIESEQKSKELNKKLVSVVNKLFHKNSEYKKIDEIEIYQLIIDEFRDSAEKEIIEIIEYSHYNMGNSYANKKKYDKAIDAYQKAVDINPTFDIAYFNMGSACYNKKEYDRAIKAYQKVVEINPQRDEAYYNMGIAYAKLGEFDKVIESYIKALNINPNKSSVYANLFELQLIQNQPFIQPLEKKYRELFKNQKDKFIKYEMLKILQNISKNEKVNLEQWKQKYHDINIGIWNFDTLDEWIDEFDEGEVKEKLREAIVFFKGYQQGNSPPKPPIYN